jgi:hypothetical protein
MENPVNHRDLEGIVVNLVNTAVPRREQKQSSGKPPNFDPTVSHFTSDSPP